MKGGEAVSPGAKGGILTENNKMGKPTNRQQSRRAPRRPEGLLAPLNKCERAVAARAPRVS